MKHFRSEFEAAVTTPVAEAFNFDASTVFVKANA
jgi:hypothetical protein